MAKNFQTFEEFYPFHLSLHTKPLTKLFHFIGTNLLYLCGITAIVTQDIRLIPLGIVLAVLFAEMAHFFIE